MGSHNMENMVNIVLVALVTLAKADVGVDLEDTVNKLVVEMNAKVGYLETEVKNLEKKMQAKDDSIRKLETDVSFLKDPPYTYYTSYQSVTTISSQTITYSSLLHSSTNVEGADMNLSTGIFTSGWGGTYTVSWSLWGYTVIDIYLRRNGAKITESRH